MTWLRVTTEFEHLGVLLYNEVILKKGLMKLLKEGSLLNKIKSPRDLKKMSLGELEMLCAQIREKIIETVSQNGGHLASNLGTVELTVALHKVFECPGDQIVFDVGHQSYTHKLLTGRAENFHTIRKEGGLSGFTRRDESIYDPVSSGHSSTSISAAFGILNAKHLKGEDGKVIAVIGDGALSGGLAYEGINNAGSYRKNFIVILNDNKMSISQNVGSMAGYLSTIRTRNIYLRTKSAVDKVLNKIPVLGDATRKVILKSTSTLKDIVYNGTVFENLGFMYYGPIDGHNIKELIKVLKVAKEKDRPVLIHVNTTKGKGYSFAEKNPKGFHGTPKFDVKTGTRGASAGDFSSVFGEAISQMAKKDKRICAITAAMKIGTGLSDFARNFKDRFFDVGIAEGHAVTFAGGLAVGGMIPIFAVYSTFLQRSYDQIIHDAALQNLKVVLAIDRAGIVGEDGETHQGVFDVAFLNAIPNVTIFTPCFFDELAPMFDKAAYHTQGVAAVRYPRGGERYRPVDFIGSENAFDLYGDSSCDNLIVTYGRLFSEACLAKQSLEQKGIKTYILKLNQIKPIDANAVEIAKNFKNVFFFEEGMQKGGIGESFGYKLGSFGHNGNFEITAIDEKFIRHASVEATLHHLKLNAFGMDEIISRRVGQIDK